MKLLQIPWLGLLLSLRMPGTTANYISSTETLLNMTLSTEELTTSFDITIPPIEDFNIADKIFSIEYKILDERIPTLMADIINENNFQYNITTLDFINVLKLRTITFTNLSDLMDGLGIEPSEINFKEAFEEFNISIIDVLKVVVSNIPDARSATPKILTSFGINPSEYMWIINFENDTTMFDLLAGGNYTEEGFDYALKLANMTEEDVLNLLRPIILQQVGQKNLTNLLALMEQYNLAQRLDFIFDFLNITADDFYKDSLFGSIISNLTNILNSQTVIATAVEPSLLVTILDEYAKWTNLELFTTSYVLNLQNKSSRYEIADVTNNTLFSEIAIYDRLGGFLVTAGNLQYSKGNYNNCQCVNQIDDILQLVSVIELTFEGDLLIGNTNGSICSLGSPLVCSNLLYGLSITTTVSPKFLTFRTKSTPPPPTHNGTISVVVTDVITEINSSDRLRNNFVALLLFLSLKSFFN